jgi:hypothetical protein
MRRKIYKYNLYLKKHNNNIYDKELENYYSILGLKNDCISEDIKTNYKHYCNKIGKQLVKSDTSNKQLAHIFDTILGSVDKAYNILLDEEKRKKYDIELNKEIEKTDYIEITAPNNRYYADPHLFKFCSKTYLFFEDYDYKKGIISCIVIDKDMNMTKPVKVLEKPYHLSFPYIFKDDKFIYMIPETSQNGCIELYKATRFPYKWILFQRLLKGKWASDTVIIEKNGIWWLFTTIGTNINNLTILYTYDIHSGIWHGHPYNNTNKICGRMAGGIFRYDNKLIRPVQCSCPKYGYCVILYEIEILSRTEYKEKELTRKYSNWKKYLVGTHTYSISGDLVVVDAKERII